MRSFLNLQVTHAWEFLVALTTAERLFVCVCPFMGLQVNCLSKLLVTLRAFEWFFICMRSLMRLQLTGDGNCFSQNEHLKLALGVFMINDINWWRNGTWLSLAFTSFAAQMQFWIFNVLRLASVVQFRILACFQDCSWTTPQFVKKTGNFWRIKL